MKKKILFFAIVFTWLMMGGNAAGESSFFFGDHYLDLRYLDRGYLDRGLDPLTRLAPRDPLANLLFDLRPGISRIKYRSLFASYGTYSYRRFPDRYYGPGYRGHYYRSSFDEYYYRHGYKQTYFNYKAQRHYYEHRLYRSQSAPRYLLYLNHRGFTPYRSGFSFRVNYR